MKSWLIIFMTVMAMNSLVYGGYVYSDYDWKQYNGHEYAITLDYSNWAQAESWAVEVGGHLVTVNDEFENGWLSNTFKGKYTRDHDGEGYQSLVWIGFQLVGSDWCWSSGEPVTFVGDWWHGSPDGGLTVAYLHTATHPDPNTWYNQWRHDTEEGYYPLGIIEIPEPATILLLGLGVLALRRRRTSNL